MLITISIRSLILLCVLSLAFVSKPSFAQEASKSDLAKADSCALEFIDEFRRTLDFAKAYDKFRFKGDIDLLGKQGFFKGVNIDVGLQQQLDEKTLLRVYLAEMNLFAIVTAHDLSQYPEGRDSYNDVNPVDKPHVVALQKADKHNGLMSGDEIQIRSKVQLEKNLLELESIFNKYRRMMLDSNIFRTDSYLRRVESFQRAAGRNPSVTIFTGGFGIKEGTPIITLQKDIFTFRFFEDDKNIRLLPLVIEG